MLCAHTLVFSQADRNTRYVAVQSTALKSSAGHFSNNVGNLSLGDAVIFILESGKWSNVRFGSLTGWVASSNLSTRRIVTSNTASVSISEVVLAGKGFSPEMELEYKKNGLDYSTVDGMERITLSSNDLLKFINEGHLFRGE